MKRTSLLPHHLTSSFLSHRLRTIGKISGWGRDHQMSNQTRSPLHPTQRPNLALFTAGQEFGAWVGLCRHVTSALYNVFFY